MRLVDLDRDMSDVIPTGTSPDSAFLFRRMESATFDALGALPGARVIDVAAGVGQDDRALAARGFRVTGAEPSNRMMALARMQDAADPAAVAGVERVRAWSERLPFRSGTFDASFCKGSLDHFDDPLRSLREMARVTTPQGRVVVAVANFESLGCRLARWLDERSGASSDGSGEGESGGGRRLYDVPSDHFTRYDPALVREQLSSVMHIDAWVGVSLFWGVRRWGRILARLGPFARPLLALCDALARLVPAWADVLVVGGRPRV